MRLSKGLLAGLAAAGLIGCSSSASGPSASGPSFARPSASGPSAKASPVPAQTGPAEPKTRAGARAAARRYDGLYLAQRFADSWDLLATTAKVQVPRGVWVGVHNGCPSAKAGAARTIKAVVVFGNAAIVTETIAGARHPAEHVFNYADGHWGYSPNDLSIYRHGSVAADITAAKAAGFCTSWKGF